MDEGSLETARDRQDERVKILPDIHITGLWVSVYSDSTVTVVRIHNF